jgi:hypothetical protein
MKKQGDVSRKRRRFRSQAGLVREAPGRTLRPPLLGPQVTNTNDFEVTTDDDLTFRTSFGRSTLTPQGISPNRSHRAGGESRRPHVFVQA